MSSSIFELPLKILPEHIDMLGHVNNVVYLEWVQQAAIEHWRVLAPPSMDEEVFWVVVRHEIDYFHSALLADNLHAKTWVGNHKGATSTRHVDIYHETKKLASAITIWCLLDKKSHRPKRVNDEIKQILAG